MALLGEQTRNPSQWSRQYRTPVSAVSSLHAARLQAGFGLCVLVLVLFLATKDSHAAASRSDLAREAQLKAVFLLNFAQFTDWPEEVFPDPSSPVVIGIVGADPFAESLEEAVKNELVHGRHVRIERYHSLAEVKKWHIIYLGLAESERLDQVLRAIKGKPVLTVSDSESSARHSDIIIKFLTKQNKIRFIINADAARQARLVLSSKLLQAADQVIDSDKK